MKKHLILFLLSASSANFIAMQPALKAMQPILEFVKQPKVLKAATCGVVACTGAYLYDQDIAIPHEHRPLILALTANTVAGLITKRNPGLRRMNIDVRPERVRNTKGQFEAGGVKRTFNFPIFNSCGLLSALGAAGIATFDIYSERRLPFPQHPSMKQTSTIEQNGFKIPVYTIEKEK